MPSGNKPDPFLLTRKWLMRCTDLGSDRNGVDARTTMSSVCAHMSPHASKEFISVKIFSAYPGLELWLNRFLEQMATTQHHPLSHTHKYKFLHSLLDTHWFCQPFHSYTALLCAFTSLTSFIKKLCHLVDDLSGSVMALYDLFYLWCFAWLYVFILITLEEVHWNYI